jgi:hypothetical protein
MSPSENPDFDGSVLVVEADCNPHPNPQPDIVGGRAGTV